MQHVALTSQLEIRLDKHFHIEQFWVLSSPNALWSE